MKPMLHRSGWAVALGCAMLMAFPVDAQTKSAAVQAALQSAYDARDAALSQANIAKFLSFYAPDFTAISRYGVADVHGKAQYQAQWEQFLQAYPQSMPHLTDRIAALTLSKSGVTVTTDGADGAPLSRDFWVRRSGQWLILRHRQIAKLTPVIAAAQTPPAPAFTQQALQAVAADPQVQTVVNANTDFGLRLLGLLTQRGVSNNIFVSPFSITQALTLAWNGTTGDTQQQIGETLGFGSATPDQINHANARLLPVLRNPDVGVQMSVGNALWADTGTPIPVPFETRCVNDYGAQASTLNFGDPGSVSIINNWVSRHTQGKITNLLNAGDLAQAQVVLTNAVYFHGKWEMPFNASRTKNARFTRDDGTTETIPLMHEDGSKLYLETDQFQAAALPYGNGRDSLYVFLPKAGTDLTSFLGSLTAQSWQQWIGEMKYTDLDVFLPRFRMQYKVTLNDPLSQLGMAKAFGPSADFSPMGLSQQSSLTWVIHEATLDVDEQGTIAAAATGVGGSMGGPFEAPQPTTFRVDHPFFCAIRDNMTGMLLFEGVIVDPAR